MENKEIINSLIVEKLALIPNVILIYLNEEVYENNDYLKYTFIIDNDEINLNEYGLSLISTLEIIKNRTKNMNINFTYSIVSKKYFETLIEDNNSKECQEFNNSSIICSKDIRYQTKQNTEKRRKLEKLFNSTK